MMKNSVKTLLVCILFLPTAGKGQINLVLNPDLEQYSFCPASIDGATYCIHWNTLDSSWRAPDWAHEKSGTPEYCNKCSTAYAVSVPSGAAYYHYPRSGNGMMQVQMFTTITYDDNARDYLQGHLAQTLTAGHNYNVCFYTALEQGGSYAVNNIGAYLDNGTIDTTHYPGHVQNQYTPQIVDTAIVYDTTSWAKIEGTFTANGTEKLITIGQFSDSVHTHFVLRPVTVGGAYTWYLIDDVSVIDCSNVPFAGNDTVIHTPDSVFIGSHEALLPYTWYKYGSTTPIDSGGGIWVKPTATTRYILEQKLCGITKMDTVKIWVYPDTPNAVSNQQLAVSNLQLYPNPTSKELTIEGAKNCEVSIYSIIGRQVWQGILLSSKETINIEGLTTGMYIVQVKDISTGEKVTGKIIKE